MNVKDYLDNEGFLHQKEQIEDLLTEGFFKVRGNLDIYNKDENFNEKIEALVDFKVTLNNLKKAETLEQLKKVDISILRID